MIHTFFFALASLFLLCGLGLLTPSTHAAPDDVYIVNASNDVNDGACNAAHCSLREAINAANAHAGPDTINFEIGGCPCLIYPLILLPIITDAVIINGYTEDGALPADSTDPAVLRVTLRGTLAPNLSGGLHITGGNTTVKGLAINGFDVYGIWLSEGDSNTIEGNFIGTFASGLTASSNGIGILISGGSHDNIIGGNPSASRNIISGNAVAGIFLSEQLGGADRNIILGNLVGYDINDEPMGNGIGIRIRSQKNRIGPTLPQPVGSNIISGNLGAGIVLDGPAARGNIISLNQIGSTNDAVLGNGTHGILIHNGARKNKIGQPGNLYNVIFRNGADGIAVVGDTTVRNAIRANYVNGNGGLGIDLGDDGVTPNDGLDADAGPNQRQNFPVLKKAKAAANRVVGKLVGKPNANYKLDLFQPIVCDLIGNGEGHILASINVTTGANGVAKFNVVLQDSIEPLHGMTATATDAKGNTSEFSQCIAVTP